MQQPIQPQFKLRIYTEGARPNSSDKYSSRGGNYASFGNHSYMDIEECTASPVTYEEQATLLNTLTFTIDRYADVLLHRMRLGQWVVLYGGYYSSDGSGMKKVFSGTVTRIKTLFPNNGKMSFRVECMSYGFTQMGKDSSRNFVYPDKNSSRNFCKGKSSISLREVITGIVEESGLSLGEISLPREAANTVFTEKSIRYQKGVSDWKFLQSLADSFGCYVWTSIEDAKETLYFVDKGKATNTKGPDLQFVYPLQGEQGVTDIKSSEIIRFDNSYWNRPRVIWDVTVDEDISLAYAVSRSAMYYDKTTGEYTEAISEVSEVNGKRMLTFYELDEAKVELINRTRPELADKIRSTGATDIPWSSGCQKVEDETPEYVRYYYKVKMIVDEQVAVFDKAFFGIYVTATCMQDLDIRSQRTYPIRGIVRYSTNDKVGSYFLRGLKHIWSSDGATTELDFIK